MPLQKETLRDVWTDDRSQESQDVSTPHKIMLSISQRRRQSQPTQPPMVPLPSPKRARARRAENCLEKRVLLFKVEKR